MPMDYDQKEAAGEMTEMGREWLRNTLAYHPSIAEYEAQGGDVRICFAIAYYTDAAEAEKAGEYSKKHYTYNGGMFDGSACHRAPEFDFIWQGKRYHAVTH